MLKEIKVELKQPQMELFFSTTEKNSFSEYANHIGLKIPFVVCHIGASSVDRLWESKNFYNLTNLILKETSFNIVFGGNKKEIKILKTLNLPDSNRIFSAFDLPLINYAYLLSRRQPSGFEQHWTNAYRLCSQHTYHWYLSACRKWSPRFSRTL